MQPSPSAIVCAAMRAAHMQFDPDPVLLDPFSVEMLPEEERKPEAVAALKERYAGPGIRRVQAHVVGRGRYADESLERAVEAGAEQYVVLGAGLDTFVLRRRELLDQLRVFELDLPETQAYKLEQLNRLGFGGHPNVEFLSVDLRTTGVNQALADSSFEPERQTFFLWVGVVSYLSNDAIVDTLRSLRACAAPGSRLVLDYPIVEELMIPEDRPLAREVSAVTERHGEARHVKHVPGDLHEAARSQGFAIVEDLSPTDMEARYFAERSDGLRPYPEIHLLQLRAQ